MNFTIQATFNANRSNILFLHLPTFTKKMIATLIYPIGEGTKLVEISTIYITFQHALIQNILQIVCLF